MTKSTAYIIFQVAETTYAISTDVVQQMEMVEQITRAPNSPEYLDGVAYLRGQVVPVINLRSRFGHPRIEYDMQARLIVIRVGPRTVALAVDRAREYLSIPEEKILPPPAMMMDENENFVRGVIALNERLLMILDVEKVLAYPEKAHA
ncbi:MAG: chemotaxis protein CheW [Chloroflexota bacterium]